MKFGSPVNLSVTVIQKIIAGTITIIKTVLKARVTNHPTAPVLATGDRMDLLVTQTGTKTATFTITIPAPSYPYGALMISLAKLGVAASTPLCVKINSNPTATPKADPPIFVAAFKANNVAGTNTFVAIVPIATIGGSKIRVQIYTTAAVKWGIAIYGLTSNPGVVLRGDGRAHPIGAFNKRSSATGAFLPSPTSPNRVLLKYAYAQLVSNSTGTGEVSVKAGTTTSTNIIEALALASQVSAPSVFNTPSGFLLKPGLPLKIGANAAVTAIRVIVLYDIVV